MSSKPLVISIRAKKLGVLIRDARLAHNKTVDECAQAIGVSSATFEAYELGDRSPSLPELELLSYYLDMPLDHFWGRVAISEAGEPGRKVDPKQLMGLRQRVIGVMLRKARLELQLPLQALAEQTNIPASALESYELGETPVPLPDLEALIAALNTSLRDYQDHHSPVGSWFTQQRAVHDFLELPLDLQAFVCKPINRPYLELAQRLSEMSVEKLRSVAEGLLEITL